MKRLFVTLLLWGVVAQVAHTEVLQAPELVNYQGRLTSASGGPLASGAVSLDVRLYAEAAGGNPIWGPQRFPAVAAVKGEFNIILGPTDETNRLLRTAWRSGEVYLGLCVDGGPEVAPRQKALSSPYALLSSMGLPVGSVVPWVPYRRVATQAEAEALLPTGFRICDGPKPDNPLTVFDERGIPDLRDQVLLKGTSPGSEPIATLGGTNAHGHAISGSTPTGALVAQVRPEYDYENWASSPVHGHTFSGVSASTNWIPKSISVIYIIRVN